MSKNRRKFEGKCVRVSVVAKDTGKQIDGILCETSRGIYFKPTNPVEFLLEGKKVEKERSDDK